MGTGAGQLSVVRGISNSTVADFFMKALYKCVLLKPAEFIEIQPSFNNIGCFYHNIMEDVS